MSRKHEAIDNRNTKRLLIDLEDRLKLLEYRFLVMFFVHLVVTAAIIVAATAE